MPLSPSVREFVNVIYGKEPRSVILLAPLVTKVYHDVVTAGDSAVIPGDRAYNAYMILAMCREMSTE